MWPFKGGGPEHTSQGPGPNDKINSDGTRSTIDPIADAAQEEQQRQAALDQQREEEPYIPSFLRNDPPTPQPSADSSTPTPPPASEPTPAPSTPETTTPPSSPEETQNELNNLKDRLEQKIREAKERESNIDHDDACAIAALEIISENAEAKMQKQYEELRTSRWDKFCQDHPTLKKITRFAGAVLGGGAISLGVKAAVLAVAGTAVLPATIIGGAVAGGIVGYKMAKSREHDRQFGAKTLSSELKMENINLEAEEGEEGYISNEDLYKKIELAQELVETRRILGQREQVENLLREIKEMQITYDIRRLRKNGEYLEQIESDEEFQQKLAEELIKIQKNKLTGSGITNISTIERLSQENQNMISQKENAEGKAGWKGAVIGATLGGVLSGLISHFTAVQGYGGGHYNPEAAANYATTHEPFNNLIQQLQQGDITNVVHEAAKNGVDLTRTVSIGGQESRLIDILQSMIQHNTGELTNSQLQTIYNMMSYPDQLGSVYNEIARQAGTSANPDSILNQLFQVFSNPSQLHQYSSVIAHQQDVLVNAARLSYLGSPASSAASKIAVITALAGSTAAAIATSFGSEKTEYQRQEHRERREAERQEQQERRAAEKQAQEEIKKAREEKAKEEKELKDLNDKVNKGFDDLEKSLHDAGDKVSNEIRERITHYIADMKQKTKNLEDLKFLDEQINRDLKLIKDSIEHQATAAATPATTPTTPATTLHAPPGIFDNPQATESATTSGATDQPAPGTTEQAPTGPPAPKATEPQERKAINDYTFPQRIAEVMEKHNYETESITQENINDLTNIVGDHAGKLFVEIEDQIFILIRDGQGGFYLRRDPKPEDDLSKITKREGREYYQEKISGKQLIDRKAKRVIELLFEEEE